MYLAKSCIGFFIFFLAPLACAENPPGALRCELLLHPEQTLLTDLSPEFSWRIPSSRNGVRQTAYQIIISASRVLAEKERGDVWDSGKVASDQSVDVPFAGGSLTPDRDYYWRVRIWCGDGKPSPYSNVQKIRFTDSTDPYATDNRVWYNRLPLQQVSIAPASMKEIRPGSYFIDFGRAAFATLRIEALEHRQSPWRVRLGEALTQEGRIDANPGGARRCRTWTQPMPLDGSPQILKIPPDRRNTSGDAVLMPPEMGEVMPFRYCELENVSGVLSPDHVQQLAVHYPFDESASSFRCSNQILNDVWDLCKYSIKATSFLGVYVDGDRERIPYEGDAYINQLSHYCVDAEYSLARHTIEYLFRHPTWPAEWQMHMVLMAWKDYLYTGNPELLIRHYEDLAAKTLLGLSREDGLIVEDSARMTPPFLRSLNLTSPPRILVDWPPASFTHADRYGERDGYDMRPVNAVANAFHYHTLRLMEAISLAAERPEEAPLWRQRADRVYRSFQTVFYDTEKGVYRDSEGSSHSALHANFFPLAFGLAPAAQSARIVAFIKSRGMACSVYGSQHLLDALYQEGESEYALSLMTATHDRSWAHMIYNVKSTITTEAWDNKYKENQDWNHAWGAAPANIIPRGLMGLEPLQPGCARMRIKPQIGNLEFAEIKHPTLRGPVTLRVEQSAAGRRLRLTLPAGMTGELHLPVTDIAAVREGDRPLAKNPHVVFSRLQDGCVVLDLASGSYFFQIN